MKGEKIDVVGMFRKGQEDGAIKYLYRYFPMVKKFIKQNGGTLADAEDIFQESLIVLYEKCLSPSFELTCAAQTYVFRVTQYKWKAELSKRRNTSLIGDSLEALDFTNLSNEDLESKQQAYPIDHVLKTLGEKCRKLLEMYYLHKMRMAEIASKLNYSTVNSAKTQKYKCLERAKANLQKLIVENEG